MTEAARGHRTRITLLALLAGLVLVGVGVVLIALGNRTHRAIKIGDLTLPPKDVRQVGAQPVGRSVQAGRDGWEIATGGLLIVDGLTIAVLAQSRSRRLTREGRPSGLGVTART